MADERKIEHEKKYIQSNDTRTEYRPFQRLEVYHVILAYVRMDNHSARYPLYAESAASLGMYSGMLISKPAADGAREFIQRLNNRKVQ